MAILVQGLVMFGNLVGRGPYYVAQGDHHHANENVVILGRTGSGRKGTSWRHARMPFDQIAPAWTACNIKKDLYTAEGLINAVRDPRESMTPADDEPVDPGVEDKRLLAFLSEFSAALKRASLPGNTLSPAIRDAWGEDTLEILTKNTAQKATNAHISIIGHITPQDLHSNLRSSDIYSGFANRFLWVVARKSQSLPGDRGPDLEPLKPLIQEVADAVEFAKSVGEMQMSKKAAKRWNAIYYQTEDGREDLPPALEALTARALPHMLRLAMIYALLDKSATIKLPHVKAARVVWRHVENSIKYVFDEEHR